ncbi:MAG TPA: amino acid adenylation domain-containing protein [Thermoanaerobaculia bacterium]|nr:amino acid adenylation domain-containing protein [Thermoanaerobaculia bacterium]
MATLDRAERLRRLSPEQRERLLGLLREQAGSEARSEAIPPRGEETPAPLSFAQERLWLLAELDPENPAYTLSLGLRLAGPLDLAALSAALTGVVRRHAVLRSVIEAFGAGGPRQRILPAAPQALPLADLAALGAARREGELARVASARANEAFDLGRGPLLRAALVRLGALEHATLLSLHHIATDGWSNGLLVREITALYAAASRGARGSARLPALPIQYADFAAWQRRTLTGEAMSPWLEYWRKRLAGAPPVLELPSDLPRPLARRRPAGQCQARLPGAVVAAAAELAHAAGTTPFVVHLAAFQALLGRLAAVDDVVVGTPLAGRERVEIEPLIGFFVRSVALRADLSGDPTFAELVARVARTTIEDFERSALPFERLVAELNPERGAATPIFQAVLAFQSAPRAALSLPGLKIAPLAVESGRAKFDLTLFAEDAGDGVEAADGGRGLQLEFDRDLFDPPAALRLIGWYREFLETAVAAPHLPVAALPRLAPAERHQLFVEWGTEPSDPAEATVHALVEASARRTPEAPALVWDGGAMTYADLRARSRRLARVLLDRGARPGEAIGLALERSPELIVAMLAILHAGCAFVPVDPAEPPARRDRMLADAGVARVVVAGGGEEVSIPAGCERIDLGRERRAIENAPSAPLAERASAETLAYVMFTSGSTGRPKGVAVPHRAVVRLVRGASFARLAADEVFVQLAPVAFDASTLEIWGALGNGARLVLPPAGPLSLGDLGDLLARHRATTLWLTAGLFHQIVDERPAALRGLRQLLAGGDALSVPHVTRALEILAAPEGALINGYGPTENTTFTCCHRTAQSIGAGGRWDGVPIGRPISGTYVRVLDRALRPVPIGAIGELYAGGRGLAQGYAGRPELTAERFVPDPHGAPGEPGARLYATGDRARFRGDGQIEFLGRADTQVKVRGFRVELEEIQAALAAHPGVASAVVAAREAAPGDGDKRLVAYFVATPEGPAPTAAALGAHLAERLPAFMIPSRFVALAALPLSANGKVDRRALPAPEEVENEGTAPRTPEEELLAGLWADLVGAPAPGVEDDFFAAGGHSLLATRLLARVEEAFAVRVPLGSFFERPSIAALAQEIDRLRGNASLGGAAPHRLPRLDRGVLLPLSFAQERLWLLDRFEPGSPAYNISAGIALRGDLDVAALAAAIDRLARRHESLRTTFEVMAGAPGARVADRGTLALPQVDLGGLGEGEASRRAEAERIARREALFPFQLARGPLLRFVLIRLAERERALSMVTHHIVSDGWSIGILVRDLSSLYAALARRDGTLPELTPLAAQYADFAAWQRAELSGAARERLLGFWREQLTGAPPMLELPTDRPRPAIRSFRGGAVRAVLAPAAADRLRALARSRGATFFMVLLAAFDLLCSRLAGQDEVVVGTPISGRKRREFEGLIGIFLNTLALRTDLSGDPTFVELLARVRRTALAAYAHQDLPFEHLLDELRPERDLSRTPLFQVFFNMLTYPSEAIVLPGLSIEPLGPPDVPAKFDLTVYLSESDGALAVEFVWNADLFSAARAAEMLRQYEALLAAVAERPEESIERYSLLTETARAALPDPRRALSDSWLGAVPERFEAQVARAPESLAVADKDESWSYRELDERTNRLAHRLRADGVAKGETVAILGHRSARLVWAVLGAMKAGAAFVVLDPAHPPARLVDCLRLAEPRGWIELGAAGSVPAAVRAALADLGVASRIALPAAPEAPRDLDGWPSGPVGVALGPDDAAYVAFTSGSTGAPKGIVGRHGPLTHFLPWQERTFGFTAADRYSLLSGLAHDPLQRDLFTPLQTGAAICVPDPAEIAIPGRLAQWLARERVTVAHLTPAMGQVLTERSPGDERLELPDLRYAFFVGDVLTRRDVARLAALAPNATAINYYGSTETQRAVGYHVTASSEIGAAGTATAGRESLPLGRGIEDVQLLVVGRGGALAGIGEVGEIRVRSPHLAAGYLGDPEGTAAKFVAHPLADSGPGAGGDRAYRTGDLGRYRPDGEVEFAGRADVQIKIRGFRIEPGEIEAQLGRHEAVREAVVVARADPSGEKRLVAYVVLDAEVAVAELRSYLRERLPDYMVPALFSVLPGLPLNPNGKVDRKALPEPAEAERSSAYVAPESEAERTIAAALREVLGVERVSRDDNFFEIGGNSLQLVRVHARLCELFGGDLKVVELFTHPTIASLAGHLMRDAARGDAARPAPPEEDRTRELLVGRDRLRRRFAQRQRADGEA